jgi:tetratricopeptide (TPR) repeat protein
VANRYRAFLLLTAFGSALALGGCAGGIERWIVTTRNHQGDMALERGNYRDAELAYKLALELDPRDEHARNELAVVELQLAQELFRRSKFDDALAMLQFAEKYNPQSVRLAALREQIDQAKTKREIVLSNYPLFRETGQQLRVAYDQLRAQDSRIVSHLQRFDYSFDTNELSSAIRNSYDLGAEIAKLTSRLSSYRDLIESGTSRVGSEAAPASGGSLLPLP